MPNQHYHTFPLRASLVAVVVTAMITAICIVLGTVGLPAYIKAKSAVRGLWEDISEQVAINATGQALRYFQSAPITLKIVEGLVEEKQLSINNRESILDICYRIMKENPEFITTFYAKKDGTFYAVIRFADGYLGSYRTPSHIENYKIGPGNKWIKTEEIIGDYDPRNRPFWKTALVRPEGGWSEPYSFSTLKVLGYTYVIEQKNGDGYWGADFEINELNQFLRSLKIGREGMIYIVSNNGSVIASSSQQNTLDTRVKELKNGYFQLNQRIFYVSEFPPELKIPWRVITSIHEDDFLKPIQKEAFHSLGYGLIPCILFVILIAFFFGKVSRRLKEIAWEMDKMSNLRFDFKSEQNERSRIREINVMNHGLRKMKVGLQSFGKYVPIDLIKKLIFSGRAAEPNVEKKQITVLFADMFQFTSLSENLKPDEVVHMIESFLNQASQAVHKEKGIIDKFIGDAVMALWGTPEPVPNSALSACRAALEMQKMIEFNPQLNHKIGINSGYAMVGNLGSNERLDYTAIGDTINIGARLEKLNKQYGTRILLGPTTAAAVEDVLLVRPLNWVTLEGRTAPLLVYELVGEKKWMPKSTIQAVAVYASALEAYRKGQFKVAAELSNQANILFGGADTPSKMLAADALNHS